MLTQAEAHRSWEDQHQNSDKAIMIHGNVFEYATLLAKEDQKS